jgi:hypothetical protein
MREGEREIKISLSLEEEKASVESDISDIG